MEPSEIEKKKISLIPQHESYFHYIYCFSSKHITQLQNSEIRIASRYIVCLVGLMDWFLAIMRFI